MRSARNPTRKALNTASLLLAATLAMTGTACAARAQSSGNTPAATRETTENKSVSIRDLTDQPDAWFSTDEGKRFVGNVIAAQTEIGGWPKGYNVAAEPRRDPRRRGVATIDNGATHSELRLLARAVRVTGREDAKASFERGVGFLFASQYENGGWPQRFPLEKNYGRRITFNDDAMVGAMRAMRDVARGEGDFSFVSAELKSRATDSISRAVACVLATQIREADGTLTAWCQQHDEVTLKPTTARTYELAAVCSSESAGIVLFLMEIPEPDARVRESIEAAVAYFERTKILGHAYPRVRGPQYEKGHDRRLVADPSAPPIWARFYEMDTNPPKRLFVDRDASKHENEGGLSHERRTGYAWYSTAPNRVLQRYPEWKAKHGK